MKYVILSLIVLTLTGCGDLARNAASLTGYSRICVDGVQYIQFTSGATVQYNAEGKVVVCK